MHSSGTFFVCVCVFCVIDSSIHIGRHLLSASWWINTAAVSASGSVETKRRLSCRIQREEVCWCMRRGDNGPVAAAGTGLFITLGAATRTHRDADDNRLCAASSSDCKSSQECVCVCVCVCVGVSANIDVVLSMFLSERSENADVRFLCVVQQEEITPTWPPL